MLRPDLVSFDGERERIGVDALEVIVYPNPPCQAIAAFDRIAHPIVDPHLKVEGALVGTSGHHFLVRAFDEDIALPVRIRPCAVVLELQPGRWKGAVAAILERSQLQRLVLERVRERTLHLVLADRDGVGVLSGL